MPKLHERIDGSFYIRVFRGEDKETGQVFIGTWQLSAKGEDRLRSLGIQFDDDDIPMDIFKELRANREIWNDNSTGSPAMKPRRKKVARTKVKKATVTRQVAEPRSVPNKRAKECVRSEASADPNSTKYQQTHRAAERQSQPLNESPPLEQKVQKRRQPDVIQQIIDFVRSLFR